MTEELRNKSNDLRIHYYAPHRVNILVNLIITAIIFALLVVRVIVMFLTQGATNAIELLGIR